MLIQQSEEEREKERESGWCVPKAIFSCRIIIVYSLYITIQLGGQGYKPN